MQKGTVCGLLHTGGGRYYYLVHPEPLEPFLWQRPDQIRFLVTYPGEQRTEKIERGGVIQDTLIYTAPFSIVVPVTTADIVLDRKLELLFEDDINKGEI